MFIEEWTLAIDDEGAGAFVKEWTLVIGNEGFGDGSPQDSLPKGWQAP